MTNPTEPQSAQIELKINIQGGKNAEFSVNPSVTVDEVRVTALRAANVIENPNERWELEYRGEVLDNGLTLAQALEDEPGKPKKIVLRLMKRLEAGIGERGASALLA